MTRPELLAPAGKYDCFNAAVNAGADAVYLAGKEFGARASAENFTTQEILKALDTAHLKNVKIYLTLNTLIKEREWEKIEPFLRPLYDNGLDGVIIQDLGLISYLKDDFPSLPIHASTQMSVTGPFAADLLKKKGVVRIVPAREVSLDEIISLKKESGLEIETFIHGAMCYCYSGRCLFSSYLGGRSGNRGRCAQPCRLNYTIAKGDKYIEKDTVKYPLSLKDMCTITCIDKLIDAGIDSFKIEGRMKSPQYVAGVTSIYRKYIDMYLNDHELKINEADIGLLKKLYIRTGLGEGYYFKHNGPDMITKLNPSYNEADEKTDAIMNEKYVHPVPKTKVMGVATLVANENVNLIMKCNDTVITVEGEMVQSAKNRPLTKEEVIKQLNKTGESLFEFDRIEVEMDDDCFMPVKALNELRRNGFDKLKEALNNGH